MSSKPRVGPPINSSVKAATSPTARAAAAAAPTKIAAAPASTKLITAAATKKTASIPAAGGAAAKPAAVGAAAKSVIGAAAKPMAKTTSSPTPSGKSPGATVAVAAEAAAAVKASADAEAEKKLAVAAAESARLNGDVHVRYNHYNKVFSIIDGKLSAEAIDEELALSFVFVNCKIHLCPAEDDGKNAPTSPKFLKEENNPVVFVGLEANRTYWAVVQEDPIESAASAARQSIYVASAAKHAGGGDDGLVRDRIENCSCIEGNPCAQPYGCKDWANRFALAKAHGWKGP
jgi:hypothetical protein